MRVPRVRFSLRLLMITIALSTVLIHSVAMPLWRYYQLPPKTRAILRKLRTTASLPGGTMPLEDYLKALKKATVEPGNNGLPIYVDPVGLMEAEKTMISPVNVPAKRQSYGKTLEEVLGQLGLAYFVKDGLLQITSKESLDLDLPLD